MPLDSLQSLHDLNDSIPKLITRNEISNDCILTKRNQIKLLISLNLGCSLKIFFEENEKKPIIINLFKWPIVYVPNESAEIAISIEITRFLHRNRQQHQHWTK